MECVAVLVVKEELAASHAATLCRSTGTDVLPEGVADGVAHLLASLHLSLRENISPPVPTSNSDYDHFVGR